ncbi:MAG TPA: hypothetical protein VK083_14325 [Nocardia sp.]|uniref:hypothetical protein n=1 Tax=Nocardia TaxID=1817 RepID=UPI002453A71C|nr:MULTISPECIES: hypothetical protein [Nocardia]HLS77957.1 hypothetical protein [Nocardia sp.]
MTVTIETRTLTVSGATLTYDIRPGNGSTTHPPLMVFGSPMEVAAFATLASHFTDRPVLTNDPRGTDRSPMTDPLARALHQILDR